MSAHRCGYHDTILEEPDRAAYGRPPLGACRDCFPELFDTTPPRTVDSPIMDNTRIIQTTALTCTTSLAGTAYFIAAATSWKRDGFTKLTALFSAQYLLNYLLCRFLLKNYMKETMEHIGHRIVGKAPGETQKM